MADPRPLTRDDLAKFLPNQRAIRAFEKLFDLIPTDFDTLSRLIQETGIESGLALSRAQQAIALLQNPNPDVVNFNRNPKASAHVGGLRYNATDDTLDLLHNGGVVQQVGLETYVRTFNNTGATLADGKVIGYAGIDGHDHVQGKYYIADASEPSIYVLGVSTQSIADQEHGMVTNFGAVRGIDTTGTPYGEVWSAGDVLYISAATAGALTNVRPTAPDLVIPTAIVLSVGATNGAIFVRVPQFQDAAYGAFYDTTDQTAALANTAYALTFDSTSASNGVSIGAPTSRVVVSESGLYSFDFSAQITSTNASTKTLWFWPRINGVDATDSAMKVSITSAGFTMPVSRSMDFTLSAGDYLEAMWATDDVNVTIEAAPSTAFAPATPSVILSVTQIAK